MGLFDGIGNAWNWLATGVTEDTARLFNPNYDRDRAAFETFDPARDTTLNGGTIAPYASDAAAYNKTLTDSANQWGPMGWAGQSQQASGALRSPWTNELVKPGQPGYDQVKTYYGGLNGYSSSGTGGTTASPVGSLQANGQMTYSPAPSATNPAGQGIATPPGQAAPPTTSTTPQQAISSDEQDYRTLLDRVNNANYGIDPNGGAAGGFLQNIRDQAMTQAGQQGRGVLDASNGGGAMGGYGYATRDAINAGALTQMDQNGRALGLDVAKYNADALAKRDTLAQAIRSSNHTPANLLDYTNQANNLANTDWQHDFQNRELDSRNQASTAANLATGAQGVGNFAASPTGQSLINGAVNLGSKVINGVLSGGSSAGNGTQMDTPGAGNTYSLSSVDESGIKPRTPNAPGYGLFRRNSMGGMG